MPNEFDGLNAECMRLLRVAGLEQAEVVRPLSRGMLRDRLVAAGRELAISPDPISEALIEGIRAAADKKGTGRLSVDDFSDDYWLAVARRVDTSELPGDEFVWKFDLPGTDDSPVWGRERSVDEAELPGEDDSKVWRKGDDEKESER